MIPKITSSSSTTDPANAPSSDGKLENIKLLASFILFIITMLSGCLPAIIILKQNYVQYAMHAGGGVLMATAFCHLMPEMHDKYAALNGSPSKGLDHQESNPLWPEILICCGFFFMYLVEMLTVCFIDKRSQQQAIDINLTSDDGSANNEVTKIQIQSRTTGFDESSEVSHWFKFIRGILVVSTFGIHLLFEGINIGLQPSFEKVRTLFIAISCHKLIIAAVVGLELFKVTRGSRLWTLFHLMVFSIISPLGIILVIVAQSTLNTDTAHPAMILIQSFSTGTLLYIIFIEILSSNEHEFDKFYFLILGFIVMTLVLTQIDDD